MYYKYVCGCRSIQTHQKAIAYNYLSRSVSDCNRNAKQETQSLTCPAGKISITSNRVRVVRDLNPEKTTFVFKNKMLITLNI